MRQNTSKRILRYRDMVEDVLRAIPATRNSDKLLVTQVWALYYRDIIKRPEGGGPKYITLEDVLQLPSSDTLTRWRRKLQEDGKYPPSEQVAKARGWSAEKWREVMTLPHNVKA